MRGQINGGQGRKLISFARLIMASQSDGTFDLILNMIEEEELMDQVFEKEIQETKNDL